eukprot:14444124-Alexandrium_andersonii.AAC.1
MPCWSVHSSCELALEKRFLRSSLGPLPQSAMVAMVLPGCTLTNSPFLTMMSSTMRVACATC